LQILASSSKHSPSALLLVLLVLLLLALRVPRHPGQRRGFRYFSGRPRGREEQNEKSRRRGRVLTIARPQRLMGAVPAPGGGGGGGKGRGGERRRRKGRRRGGRGGGGGGDGRRRRRRCGEPTPPFQELQPPHRTHTPRHERVAHAYRLLPSRSGSCMSASPPLPSPPLLLCNQTLSSPLSRRAFILPLRVFPSQRDQGATASSVTAI
jgi:hypothetical protein